MRRVCECCRSKVDCSYIKSGKEGDCIDVQTSDYGYEEAIDNACKWLEANYSHFDGMTEDFMADFKKAMKE